MDEKAEVLCFLLDLSKLDEVKEDRLKREMIILKIGFFQDMIEYFNQEKNKVRNEPCHYLESSD